MVVGEPEGNTEDLPSLGTGGASGSGVADAPGAGGTGAVVDAGSSGGVPGVGEAGNRLRFEFETSRGYGPVRYDLERI